MKKHLLFASAALMFAASMTGQTKDPTVYAPSEGYTLTNLWNRSRVTNDLPTELNFTQTSRGMAFYKDKLYFSSRSENGGGDGDPYLLEYDAATGAFIRKIDLPAETKYGFACNDIQVDDAGHLLIANMTSGLSKTALKIWWVDPEAQPVAVKEVFSYIGDDFVGARIDYFDAWGDITKDGIVMAPISGTTSVMGNMVIKWTLKDGAISEVLPIQIKEYYPATATQNNTGPRVCIVDENLFYLDGFESTATLYDKDGVLVESFGKKNDAGEGVGEGCTPLNVGNNGVDEFTYNNDNFIVYIYSNNVVTPPQAWNVCKLGPDFGFPGMKLVYQLPKNGMGVESNGVRTALARINVKDDGAYIYLYATNNGIAAYKLAAVAAGMEQVTTPEIAITLTDGLIQAIGASAIEVYTIDGKKLASAEAEQLTAPAVSGFYVVKAIVNGTSKIQKIVVE